MDVTVQQRIVARGLAARESIVDAACRRIAEVGYEACSIADLAALAGVSKNQLFHHFGSKEGIGAAAAARLLKAWQDALITPAAIYPEARAKLGFAFTRLAELSATGWVYDRLLAALTLGLPGLPPELAAQVGAAATEIRRFFSGVLKDMPPDPRSAPAERPKRLASLLVSLIIGSAAARTLGEPFGDPEALKRALRQLAGLEVAAGA